MRTALLLLACAAMAGPANDSFVAIFQDGGQATLEGSPKFTLFSLAPHAAQATPLDRLNQKKTFHGYLILGSTEVKGQKKMELLGKLYTAIAANADPAKCFLPRHGIRATDGERSVDLVICFQCRQIQSYVNGREGGGLVSDAPQKYFDEVLRQARVPLPRD